MIILYELHWSHYCEKIRWALDFKQLSWKKININAFTKKEIIQYGNEQNRHLVPFIFDDKTSVGMQESTPILRYFEQTYPDSPALFPIELDQFELVDRWLIELDSKLGLAARRLGYAQLIMEKPTILATLFLPQKLKLLALPGFCHLSSAILSMLLIKRFQLEKNEEYDLYEEVESYLISLSKILENKKYLAGDKFSAVDLTLAVYLRPLRIVPFFYDNPQLKSLFSWQENLFREHNREDTLLYETLIVQNRQKKPPVRRKIRDNNSTSGYLNLLSKNQEGKKIAFNDQESVWTWKILLCPYYLFFKIKKRAISQFNATESIR
ncbi:MAG: glutathione S-transferase [Legionellales bacterium]|nr:glutathione S-transferase [Legionellales bacterium]